MMKVQNSSEKVTPFGGIAFVHESIRQKGIPQTIDETLGSRPPQAFYSWSDILTSLWYIFLSGGSCSEDLQHHLRPALTDLPDANIPSADTILTALQGISPDCETYTSQQDVSHEFAFHPQMNSLLLRLTKNLDLINEQAGVLDYDNTIVETDKHDATYTYHKKRGYQPGVACVDDVPVYVEGRNGNSQAKYKQHETLKRVFSHLGAEGIGVRYSRMDCASYQEDVIDLLEQHTRYFYVRAMNCNTLREQIKEIDSWQKVRINGIEYEIASIEYKPFGGQKSYRLVLSRQNKEHNQRDLFSGDTYIYRGILTSDRASSDEEVVRFYNQRGRQEQYIEEQKNDFGWHNLPFSFLNQNTTYMIVMAMCRNIYRWLISSYSKKLAFLQPHYRLRKFIFRFINVAGKWIRRGRQTVLKLFTNQPYQVVLE
jgi:hypothetical protein